MNIAQHTIWIARPREDVFATFVDFSKAPRWRQYVESMQVVGSGPLQVGSRIRTVISVMGRTETFEMEVLAFDPPALWRHHTFEPDFTGYIEYRFDAEGGETRVTMTINVRPATLYGWLAIPILLLRRNKPYAEQLPQLKRLMEGAA